MNTVNFYNGNRQLEMFFSKFKIQKNKPDFHDFVLFQIDVEHNFIQRVLKTECLDIDFINFLTDLRKLYRMEVKTISFVQTIEKNIEINFNLTELGHILVYVTIQKIDSSVLQFSYGTDLSFLPQLIDEIDMIIKEMEITN